MTAATQKSQVDTGCSNNTYNLISILYHSLEGAATYEQYINDARQTNDNELADYFQEVKNHYTQLAQRGQNLLKQRMS